MLCASLMVVYPEVWWSADLYSFNVMCLSRWDSSPAAQSCPVVSSRVGEYKMYADDCFLLVNSREWLSKAEKRLQPVFELIPICCQELSWLWLSENCIKHAHTLSTGCVVCTLSYEPVINPNPLYYSWFEVFSHASSRPHDLTRWFFTF